MKTEINQFLLQRSKGGTLAEVAKNQELAAEIIEGLSADLKLAFDALNCIAACDHATTSAKKAFKVYRELENREWVRNNDK